MESMLHGSDALPFSSQTPHSNSLNTSFTSSIESDHLDFLANLSPGENSNLTNSDTNINQPTTPVTTTSAPELNQMKEHVSSEVVSSSTSSTLFDSQYSSISSPANGPAEIKLKLSKNLFTSQYSSTTVTQSPVPDNSSPPQLKASSSPKMLICSLQSAPPHIRSLFTTLQHLNKNVSASLGSLTTTTTTIPSPNKSALLLSPPPPPPPQAQATTLLTVPNDHHQHHHHLHHQPIITSPSSKQSSSSRGRNRSQSEEHQQLSSSSSSRKVHSSRKRPKKGKPEKDFTDLLLHLLRQIKRKDAQNFFLYPVTDAIAPGYSALITTPMDLTTMQAAIEGQKQQQQQSSKYLNLGDFIADVKLICDNAMKYNHPDTVYYKAAAKLWHFTNSKLTKKEALVSYAKNYAKCTPLELSLTASSTSSSFHRLSQPSTNQTLFDQKSSTSLSMHTSAAVFSSSSTGALPSFSTLYPPTSSAPAVSSSSSSSLAENAVVSTNSDTQQQLSSYLPDLQYEVPPNAYPAQQLPPLQPPPALPVEAKEKRESEMTTEEMVASIQASARKAAENLRRYRGVPRLSYLSENPNIAFSKSGVCDGSVVVLNTLCTGDVPASSKPISLKHLAPLVTDPSTSEEGADKNISAEQQTTKELQTEEAEEKTNSKPATESTEKLEKSKNEEEEEEEKEDSLVKKIALEIKAKEKKIEELRRKLIPAVYEDDDGLNYALSISRFTRDIDEHSASNRIIPLALNKLTTGKHRKSLDTFNKLLLLN
ncbi:Bromodomain containing protein 7 [Tyrophagus putrescentiae]|nr:Bromodomain containing protein 7 [Tyrophagus putrescentiae]